jgi:molybdenum-dependent DNA-binding transcriptional regulator ModE
VENIAKKKTRSLDTARADDCPLGDVRVRYFLAVCEHASFSLAAEACGVSQPSVSTAVRRLERAVGGRLFERRHPVRMTSLGTQLRPMLEEMQATAVRIAAFLDRQRPGRGEWNSVDKSGMADTVAQKASRHARTSEP